MRNWTMHELAVPDNYVGFYADEGTLTLLKKTLEKSGLYYVIT